MINEVKIDIAKDYNPYPAGRDEHDGPFNGQKFRKEILLPKFKEALDKKIPLVVYLFGVKSFGSSFLDEAFGGLVRKEGVKKTDVNSFLKIDVGTPDNLRYKLAIERYINRV
jgi:STAS-like domain of unknown function (DUF4325)